MYSGSTSTRPSHRQTALAMNLGPLSERMHSVRLASQICLRRTNLSIRASLVILRSTFKAGDNRHRKAVKGIAFMEAIVAAQGRDHWDKMRMRSALEALSSDAGDAMVPQNDYFIEEILPNAILRKLFKEELAEYRWPFAEPGEGRPPTLTGPREIPIEGELADVHEIATEYAEWRGTSNVPRLFLKAEPGVILANDRLVNLRGWPAVTEKTVAENHFVQGDSPYEIGQAIASWLSRL